MTKLFSIKPIRFFILGMLLIPACQSATPIPPTSQPPPPTSAPTDTPLPLASPTSPGPRSMPPVSPEQTESAATTTNNEGVATFDDPLSEVELTVEFLDEKTQAPVADLEVGFVSNGPKVLVIASDPNGEYAPVIKEVVYEELALNLHSGKLAMPARELTLATVLLLVKLIDLYQDIGEWQEFLADLPSIEEWSISQFSLCVNPEQAQLGLSFLGKRVLDLLLMKFPGDDEILEATGIIFEELGEEGVDGVFEGYAKTSPPSIMRFTVYSFNGGFLPSVMYVDGFCLESLNQSDPQSALDWLMYGLENQDLYPFKILADPEGVGYASYIEGGQSNSNAEFMNDLEARLSNGAVCRGFAKTDYYLQVWTTNWSPPWEMTEYCYVDCSPITPPYQSTDAGFFLSPIDGEWWLTVGYLNTPENYFFVEGFQMVSCDTPYEMAPDAYSSLSPPTTESSCPGAPPQRMVIDQRGYVCTQEDGVFLRTGPGRSNDRIIRLEPGTPFTVTGGPACADDWSWWEIRTDDGFIGWISEGGDEFDPYYICPLP